jgi:YYY domain-containing protein
MMFIITHMGTDIWYVLRWWGTLFLVGSVAYPLARRLFASWWDRGYLFAKAIGIAVTTYLVFASATLHLTPFSQFSIAAALAVLFAGGIALQWKTTKFRINEPARYWVLVILEEIAFFLLLLFWSWVKGHEPSIRNLEKFMDYGFTQSILHSVFFPPGDMWWAGSSINYYYFGHMVMAVLTKLSGIDLSITFNLMLATIFALCGTMSFSIGVQIIRFTIGDWRLAKTSNQNRRTYSIFHTLLILAGGVLTAFLVTLGGNLQTIYAFTKGYTGENVKPFWQLLWAPGEFWARLSDGLNIYWYPNATRFIPYTIHEFPSYSFVVSDMHGHVLSIPFVLLAIALLIVLFGRTKETDSRFSILDFRILHYVFYGFLVAVLLMTNALDGPIYGGLFCILIISQIVNRQSIFNWKWWLGRAKAIGFVAISAGLTAVPFLAHFSSFVNGLAINCPPAALANTKIGPFLFETVDKCQKSPLWMLALLWGFFWYCGIWLISSKLKVKSSKTDETSAKSKVKSGKLGWFKSIKLGINMTQLEKLLTILFFYSLALTLFAEFFYFKDIYPQHFRSNTMFKLGYQAFMMFGIISGYSIISILFRRVSGLERAVSNLKARISKLVFLVFLAPLLFLVSVYPIFSVRSYFDSLRTYQGLFGLQWLVNEYPNNYKAIIWLNTQVANYLHPPVIVEADGDSYTDYNHVSAFTGFPTVVGWAVHEWLWRGSYDVISPRREEVRLIYESTDEGQTLAILSKYQVRFIMVGRLERTKFKQLNEAKFAKIGREAFRSEDMVVYEVSTGL